MRSLALLLLLARAASADPSDLVARPIVLADQQVEAQLVIEANLATKDLARPLSFAPDVWFGVTSHLTIGLVHSDPSLDRIQPGASLCVRTDGFLCSSFYRGSALDARYEVFSHDAWAIAPRARFLVRDVDPFLPALALGATVGWHHGRYAVTADPYLQLGLANTNRGNRAQLWIPIVLGIQPTCRWVVELHTGWNSDLAVANDGWHIPIGFAVRAAATPHLDLGAELGFTTLLGPQNNPKQRVAFLTIGWRT